MGGAACGLAEVRVRTGHQIGDASAAAPAFRFEQVPPPASNDAATRGKFSIVVGTRDPNGGEVAVLHDGRLPAGEDRPGENFFFAAGTDGGRLLLDLGSVIAIHQVNTYSWHRDTRGPQVYRLYGSDGAGATFNSRPERTIEPTNAGWQFVARIDTRRAEGREGGEQGERGGRHGVSISEAKGSTGSSGSIGKYRYLLFDIGRTEDRDDFGNTFFSEIDVLETDGPTPIAVEVGRGAGGGAGERPPIVTRFAAGEGRYGFALDTTVAPDLTEWAERELRPVVQGWYPKLVALLPSEGYVPRTNVTIRFREDMGRIPASAGGGFINCNAVWFRKELNREARGSVVHEMVHVVQAYARVRRTETNATRMPGWLVEGIPDYIRWFLYEPQTDGARITTNILARASYDSSYRITGNFLDWVVRGYDTNIVVKLNAAGRAGRYQESIWKEATGRTLEELGAEWRRHHEKRLGVTSPANGTKAPATPTTNPAPASVPEKRSGP
jgi:hypothetical protein